MTTRLRTSSWWALSGVVLALAGCAQSPVDDRATRWLAQTSYTAPSPVAKPDAQMAEQTDEQTDAWWQSLGGDGLHQLVRWGLTRNLDIGIALTRVAEARAGATAQSSALWPTIGLEGGYVNKRSSLPDAVKQGRPDTRAWQGALNMGWELDLFGRNRMASDAADQDVLSSEAGVAGARLVLVSEIATQYVLHHGAQRRLSLMDELIASQEKVLSVVLRRASEGEEAVIQVAAARARLAELRAQRQSLDTLRAVTRARLLTLTLATPQELDTVLAIRPADSLHAAPPEAIPAGQPVALLMRRPDLMAARTTWLAEQKRLSTARTDMLPRIFFSLLTGSQDLRINGMDLAPASFRETALIFALPLFNAGRVQAGIDRQEAVLQRAGLQYEKAARQAVEDVESALADFNQSRVRAIEWMAATQAREQAAARGARLFDEGQIAATDRLALSQAHLATQLSQVDALERAWLARIQVHRALGGGWQAAPRHELEVVSQESRP